MSQVLDQVYSGKVRAVAANVLRNKGLSAVDADDITQEVAIASWQGGYTAVVWKGINHAKNALIAEGRRGGSMTKHYIDASNEPEGASSPLERLIQTESAQAVSDAIGGLPEAMQQVIRMRFFEDKTFRQIAFEMTGNPNSVQGPINKLKQAIQLLAERLKGIDE